MLTQSNSSNTHFRMGRYGVEPQQMGGVEIFEGQVQVHVVVVHEAERGRVHGEAVEGDYPVWRVQDDRLLVAKLACYVVAMR